MPAPHPFDLRHRAVQLAHRDKQPIAALAKQLSISETCLQNWMAQADVDENGSKSHSTSTKKPQLTQLRRNRRRLEMQNKPLKRAAAYFARGL
ncbi:MAG: transposase [Pseudonocardiaceae bacterium]